MVSPQSGVLILHLNIIQHIDRSVVIWDNSTRFHSRSASFDVLKEPKVSLWLYSPYLCATGMVEMLNLSYEWGTKCWDRSGYMKAFFHLYDLLL